MDRFVYKSNTFICPKCGNLINSYAEMHIRSNDVCPQCYWQWHTNPTTNVLTCVRIPGTVSKMRLVD